MILYKCTIIIAAAIRFVLAESHLLHDGNGKR